MARRVGGFEPRDAGRIARAVRRSESRAGGDRRRAGGVASGGQLARIVSNDGSGDYTITLQVWSVADQAFADVPETCDDAVNASAQDLNQLAHGSVGDVVRCWCVRDSNDETLFLIDVGPNLDHSGTEQAMLPTTFETETAQTDTWDRNSPSAGKTGVTLRHCTRIAYDDTGDEKLYAYYRTLTYDVWGRLDTISAETRVTIDTPEAC